MKITISMNGVQIEPEHSRTFAVLTDFEKKLVNICLQKVFEDKSISDLITFSRRSDSYLTVSISENYDFLRIKATPRVLWFSVAPAKEDYNNPMFDSIENKKMRHWKIKLNSVEQAKDFCDIIYRSAIEAKAYYDAETVKEENI